MTSGPDPDTRRRAAFAKVHSDTTGRVRPDLWLQGIRDFEQLDTVADVSQPTMTATKVVGLQWEQIGPEPIVVDKNPPRAEQDWAYQGKGPVAGEVTDIAIDPSGTEDLVLYVATNDGGVWKSVDGGKAWKPKTDGMPSLSMGAIAIDPGTPGTVYAGTGNLFDGGGLFTKGVGIYKSIDAGETWSILGEAVFTGYGINRIAVPVPHVLLVASDHGLYISIDGGSNFGANAPAFSDGKPLISDAEISDLKLHTVNPTTIAYVAMKGVGIKVLTMQLGSASPSVAVQADLFGVGYSGQPTNFGRIAL